MGDSLKELVESLAAQGRGYVEIEVGEGLPPQALRAAIIEALELESSTDIRIRGLPMCFLPEGFDHFDNGENPRKTKAPVCTTCRFNQICKGFLPEMGAYVSAVPELPNEVVIEVTDRCNLRCSFCLNKHAYSVRRRNTRMELGFEQICSLIDNIALMGVRVVRLSGGEPLLRHDIFEIMDYARSLGLRVWLNSNGTFITKDNASGIKKFVENLLLSGNLQRGNTIEGVIAEKLKLAALLKGLPVLRLGVVLTPENVRVMDAWYKLGEMGFYVEFYRPILHGKAATDALKEGIARIYELNIKRGKNFRIANALPFCYHGLAPRVCLGGIYDDGASRIVIDTKGDVKPSYYSKERLGNALRTPLYSIWQSKRAREIRGLCDVHEGCKECDYLPTCRGGSRALYVRGRDPLMKSPIIKKQVCSLA